MATEIQEFMLNMSVRYSSDLALGFELGTVYAYLSNGQDLESSVISESLRAPVLELCRIYDRSPAFAQADAPGFLLFSTQPLLSLVK